MMLIPRNATTNRHVEEFSSMEQLGDEYIKRWQQSISTYRHVRSLQGNHWNKTKSNRDELKQSERIPEACLKNNIV